MVKLKPILAIGLAFSLAVPIPAYAETETITSNTSQEVKVTADIPSSWTGTLPKAITLSSEKSGSGTYTGSIPVTVTGDIGVKEVITVDTNRSLQLSDSTGANTGSIKANITKAKTEFNFNDLTGNQTAETAHNVSADLVPGDWSGTAPFYINITNQVITVTAKDSQGNNLNASANEITGQQKDDLLNSLLNSNMISSTASVDALIEVKSDQFDGIASTELEVSSLYKDGTKVAILHFDEIEQEWEYIGTDTVENGLISGDFSSYSPVVFVKVNDDESFTDITYTPFTLTKDNCTQAGIDRYGKVASIPKTFKYKNNNYIITSIASDCFWQSSLEKVTIPSSVTYIGTHAFESSPYLTTVTFESGSQLQSIANYGFNNCPKLSSIILPEGLKTLGESVFADCSKLKSVYLPSTLISMGVNVFNDCAGLTSINIPENVTSIGKDAFAYCSNLANVTFKDTTTWYVGTSAGATTTQIDVTNTSNNAKYLKTTYRDKYWTKTE